MQELKFVWLNAVALAWKDAAFKQSLLENPRMALKTSLGIELPEDVELRVHEGSQEQALQSSPTALGKLLDIVLPPAPADSRLQVAALSNYAKVVVAGKPCGLSSICCAC